MRFVRTLKNDAQRIVNGWHYWRIRKAPVYCAPTAAELKLIEEELLASGVKIVDYAPVCEDLRTFKDLFPFPQDYFDGPTASVWDEKMVEHWIAAERLGLLNWEPEDVYIDIAAANSPWVKMLRERCCVDAWAIDSAAMGCNYRNLFSYRTEDATATSFIDQSVKGASLQCAFEMFQGNDDTKLIKELARILKPGGKVVILPLYMHTHYCAYSTPEYYGRGHSDPVAKEYVRLDSFGVPSSRKYSIYELKKRILQPIEHNGLGYQLLVLRNKPELGRDIYCHFILEIVK